jgi:ankyrin repeat protein
LFSLCFASEGHFWGQSLAQGETPLHWAAAESGQVEVVNLLLEAKASVTVKDDIGRGPRMGDVMGF